MRVALAPEELANAPWEPFVETTSIEVPFELGFQRVYAQVRDDAGNASRVGQAPVVIVDDQPPGSEADADDDYDVGPGEVDFEASDYDGVSPVASVELWWRHRSDGNADWTSWTLGPSVSSLNDPFSFEFPAGAGEYEFYTIAVDTPGNREEPPGEADDSTVAYAVPARTTLRASVSGAGGEGNGSSDSPALSADGRYIAFSSEADNLALGDLNGAADVFVRAVDTGATGMLSRGLTGLAGLGDSTEPDISADGRYVVFTSDAPDLVAGDLNGAADVYLHDRDSGLTTLVSLVPGGGSANGSSDHPTISADGSTIAFRSAASNLVANDTNAASDVFVMDRASSVITRVSVGAGGVQADGASGAPDLDAEGATVAFDSVATNLVAADTNGASDVFIRDRTAAETSRVSVAWDGAEGDADSSSPSISGDGTVLAFVSSATTFEPSDLNTLADIYAVNLAWPGAWRVSVDADFQDADGPSWAPSISSDGVRVAFVSAAGDLVADDTNSGADAFVRDLNRERTWRWTLTALDGESSGEVATAALSGDASVLAFVSAAADLVLGDTNSASDVFLRVPE